MWICAVFRKWFTPTLVNWAAEVLNSDVCSKSAQEWKKLNRKNLGFYSLQLLPFNRHMTEVALASSICVSFLDMSTDDRKKGIFVQYGPCHVPFVCSLHSLLSSCSCLFNWWASKWPWVCRASLSLFNFFCVSLPRARCCRYQPDWNVLFRGSQKELLKQTWINDWINYLSHIPYN